MNLTEILEQLPDAHIVGGAVRDQLMGITPHDYDIVTSATPPEISSILPIKTHDIGGAKYGTVIVHTDDVGQVEITTMRKDLTGGRHPSVQFTNKIEEDLVRRDFTINAMAINADQRLIDPFNGASAIRDKLLIPILPDETFTITKGDPLRVLRAIRFTLQFNLSIDNYTAFQISSADLSTLSGERIYSELAKMMESKPISTLICLNDYTILRKILPEVYALQNCNQDRKHHPEGNAYDHTLLALNHVKTHSMLTKMAVLLHDIGKPVVKNGTLYHGHDKAGIPIAETILRRLGRPKKEIDAISFIIANHMKIHNLHLMKPSKRRHLYENPNFELLLTVNEADTSMRPISKQSPRDFFNNDTLTRTTPIKPLLNGHELMALGMMGVEIGITTADLIDQQISGNIKTKEEAYTYLNTIQHT